MESLLAFADELERRDAAVARALAEVEALQAEVDELRTHARAVATFLSALPDVTLQREADVRAARAVRDDAAAALRAAEDAVTAAEKDAARLDAERVRAEAADSLAAAELWVTQAQEASAALARTGDAQRAEAEQLVVRATELAPRVRDVPPPGGGEGAARDWASQARGALLLERSNLAREREALVREASELVASITGEPLVSTGVQGIRTRLELALGAASA